MQFFLKPLTSLMTVLGLLMLAHSSNSLIATYQSAKTIKVVFNKNFFYNNSEPLNSIGCAGDTKYYFDPTSDRITPAKPNWLKNVSLDITNANAPYGASKSLYCSYGANDSSLPSNCLGPLPGPECNVPPPPSMCASFDDLQALSGYNAKTYIFGGVACETPSASSDCNSYSTNVYQLEISKTDNLASPSAAATFTKTTMTVPNQTVFKAAAYDSIHDQLLAVGGVNSTGTASSEILRLYQTPTPTSTVSTDTVDIESVTSGTTKLSSKAGTSGFRLTDDTVGGISNQGTPAAHFGQTLTYIPTRNEGISRRGADTNDTACSGSYTTCMKRTISTSVASDTDSHGWEDNDYFLSIGGMTSSQLLSNVLALNPHRIALKDSTGDNPAIDALAYDWLSHGVTSGNVYLNHIMPVVDLSTDGSIPTSWSHDDRFGRTAGRFPARAFHRSAYDPFMKRVYIFGGLIHTTNATHAPTAAGTSYSAYGTYTNTGDTNLATTAETWIYDVPASGKTPTLACRSSKSPIKNTSLPGLMAQRYNSTAQVLTDLSSFRKEDLEYESNSVIFPAGGCMQYAEPVTASPSASATADDGGTSPSFIQPTGRLEHAMAFDEARRVVIMFGGCINAPINDLTASTIPYNPTEKCINRSDFLNDTWMYIPPDTYESALVTPLSGSGTNYTFGRPDFISPLDPLLNGLPLIFNNSSTSLSYNELQARTNGTWIKLFSDDSGTSQGYSSTQPLARASAGFWYDKAHQKFYLFGGVTFSGNSPRYLNDLWEFTPPDPSSCTRSYTSSASEISCSSSGTWKMIYNQQSTFYTSNPSTASNYPAPVMAPIAVQSIKNTGDYYHYGDGFYTVSDGSCTGQGPIIGATSTSKENVGAIYVDIDRSQFGSKENLLINLKLLPFSAPTFNSGTNADNNDGTRLPGYNMNGSYSASTEDDRITATENDHAYIKVSLLVNPLSTTDMIMTQLQPRMRTYQPPGTPIVAQEFDFVSSGSGQPIEKQLFIPLSLDSRINMIKIERIKGTAKFYDMTLTKF